jgi:hypothetical protein
MSDYRVYDTRGARARSHPDRARRERARPTREAVTERGRRLKRASHRGALLCFATFAVLAGLRAGPSGSSTSSASPQLRHHRARRHVHAWRHVRTRHASTTRARSTPSTSTATAAPSGTSSNLATQQTSQQPVVQSSGS